MLTGICSIVLALQIAQLVISKTIQIWLVLVALLAVLNAYLQLLTVWLVVLATIFSAILVLRLVLSNIFRILRVWYVRLVWEVAMLVRVILYV